MTRNTDQQLQDRTAAHVVSIMTTEHFALQGARSATISETNGRSSLFLSSVSSGLVALAFTGQASHMGTAFDVFGLALFPTLYFLGIFTYLRVLQSALEDLNYALGVNRIRHFYFEIAPQIKDYVILSAHDDQAGVMRNMAVRPSPWQLFLTTAGMVAVIASVLGGAFAGLAIHVLAAGSLALAMGVAIGVFLLSALILERHQHSAFIHAERRYHSLSPSPPDEPSGAKASRFRAVHVR